MIKKITFPTEEIPLLKKRDKIITTRISREYNIYEKGDILETPWKAFYLIEMIEKINDIKDHPYYSCLTSHQIRLISKYKRIAVLTLKKLNNP